MWSQMHFNVFRRYKNIYQWPVLITPHLYIHTYIHTYTLTYIHTCTYMYIHIYIHIYRYIVTCSVLHVYTTITSSLPLSYEHMIITWYCVFHIPLVEQIFLFLCSSWHVRSHHEQNPLSEITWKTQRNWQYRLNIVHTHIHILTNRQTWSLGEAQQRLHYLQPHPFHQ